MPTIVVCILRRTGEEGRYAFPSESAADDFAEEASRLAREKGAEIDIRKAYLEE